MNNGRLSRATRNISSWSFRPFSIEKQNQTNKTGDGGIHVRLGRSLFCWKHYPCTAICFQLRICNQWRELNHSCRVMESHWYHCGGRKSVKLHHVTKLSHNIDEDHFLFLGRIPSLIPALRWIVLYILTTKCSILGNILIFFTISSCQLSHCVQTGWAAGLVPKPRWLEL